MHAGSEIVRQVPSLSQVSGGWTVACDAAGWTDVISSDRVAQQEQHTSVLDTAQLR